MTPMVGLVSLMFGIRRVNHVSSTDYKHISNTMQNRSRPANSPAVRGRWPIHRTTSAELPRLRGLRERRVDDGALVGPGIRP